MSDKNYKICTLTCAYFPQIKLIPEPESWIKQTNNHPIHLYLIFEKSSSTNWILNLQKSILKLIFAGYTGSKNPVWNRLKIQFVELDFSKLIFQKSSTDQQGESFCDLWMSFKTYLRKRGFWKYKSHKLWF